MEESWLASCEAHCDGELYLPTVLHEAIRKRRTWFWDDPQRAMTGRMDLDAASREIVSCAFADLSLKDVALAHRIADDYRQRRFEVMAPYSGAVDVLETLRARGMRMALITNGNAISQRRSVERFGLAPYFDCVVIEGEFGVGKPDERVFLHALASCGVEAARTWMVGDSLEADIVKPLELGMHTVWIDEQGVGLPSADHPRPHRVITSIIELLDPSEATA
jgi:putative hydrolase of the HAD superfamily